MQPLRVVASGGFEPNATSAGGGWANPLSVENLGLRNSVPHLVRGSHRTALEGVPTLDTFASGRRTKRVAANRDMLVQFSQSGSKNSRTPLRWLSGLSRVLRRAQ